MRIEQRKWTRIGGWASQAEGDLGESAQLVLVFGATPILRGQILLEEIKERYPAAHFLGCSSAGEICGTQVSDDSVVSTAMCFEHTRFTGAQVGLSEVEDSFRAGERLAQSLDPAELVHVLVLSDGLRVNGSDLVRGLTSNLPDTVTITGGLAGDGERFQETLVLWDDDPKEHAIAALGFYGNRLRVGYGSLGGWDPFGPERCTGSTKALRLDGLLRWSLQRYSEMAPVCLQPASSSR